MKKVLVKLEDQTIKVGFDGNEDGEPSTGIELNLKETLEEIVDRAEGEEVVVNSVVKLKFEGTRLEMTIDTDKDGTPIGKVFVDLAESGEEALSLFSKKES